MKVEFGCKHCGSLNLSYETTEEENVNCDTGMGMYLKQYRCEECGEYTLYKVVYSIDEIESYEA